MVRDRRRDRLGVAEDQKSRAGELAAGVEQPEIPGELAFVGAREVLATSEQQQPPHPGELLGGDRLDPEVRGLRRPVRESACGHRLSPLLGRERTALGSDATRCSARRVGIEHRPLGDRDHDQTRGRLDDLGDGHGQGGPCPVEDPLPDHVGGQSGRDAAEGGGPLDRISDTDDEGAPFGIRETDDGIREHLERSPGVRRFLLLELELIRLQLSGSSTAADAVEELGYSRHVGESAGKLRRRRDVPNSQLRRSCLFAASPRDSDWRWPVREAPGPIMVSVS
jgi:hypothetical protein